MGVQSYALGSFEGPPRAVCFVDREKCTFSKTHAKQQPKASWIVGCFDSRNGLAGFVPKNILIDWSDMPKYSKYGRVSPFETVTKFCKGNFTNILKLLLI